MIISQKSPSFKEWLPFAILIVAGIVVCLISATTPNCVDAPQPIECPYQTETQLCPYMDR